MVEGRISNRDFADNNQEFIKDCEKVNLKPTKRQASKYRRKTGKAYKGTS